jgi:UDP-N-acetyl-alpha-D-muramoyl-L-alanyl-L-glutamate epimerase
LFELGRGRKGRAYIYNSSVHYEELRRKYPVFRYDSFSFEKTPERVIARFKFSAPPDISFSPEVIFEAVPGGWHSVPDKFLNNAIFHLGLIELFSYWKATASPVIEIRAGGLILEQLRFWEDLLLQGMGEFFYRNDIDFTVPNFVKITSSGTRMVIPYLAALPQRSLLTIGGGRDSALAAGILRDSGQGFVCMMLNPSTAAEKIAARVTKAPPVIVRRTICPELLELNQRGYLNGHTPFSAYLAFLGAASMLLYGYSNVIVANERSSDEANISYRGSDINHQYSKTFRFETLFDQYMHKYLITSAKYFSLVRPLYELQIGRLFSKFPEFFELFKSCNRNRSASWCGQCPKCLSVFITMYPFARRETLIQIFGKDLYQSQESIPIIRQLAGLETKPFECVGTTREIIAALSLAVENAKKKGELLPAVLTYAIETIPGVSDTAAASDILSSYGPHRLSPAFESSLTKVLNDSPRSL